MTALRNDLFLRALRREAVERTPVWIMRQAGRYLPEYREVRRQAGSFMQLCTSPELACQVTMQPLDRFELDAAILFSDILTIPGAMGLGLDFHEGEGPRFERPVRSKADIAALCVPDPETELRYVMDAVRLIRHELDGRVPLIGFAGSPWTLATYMVEGGSSATFSQAKRLIYSDPQSAHRLLALLARSVSIYLEAQAAAGAQALMIFDTWGGALTPAGFREFSLTYMREIIDHLAASEHARDIPVTLFTKGAGGWLSEMAHSGCAALGIDWTVDLADARRAVNDTVALQGNMDPAMLYASPERIREQVAEILRSFGHGNGHIMNLGHGVQPTVNPDRVADFVNAVRELSPAYH
ncbi:MAG: uroporphyrinogen decarboxylase [Gammaproteobacteria bacterium]|jgi:uroporphyrinogen decarboxylase